MKTLKRYLLMALIFVMFYLQACKKDPGLPIVTTTPVSEITSTTAMSGGIVKSEGDAEVSLKGVCWGTSPDPTVTCDKTNEGTGEGSFTSYISGLQPETTYYLRAYATNSAGTGYGSQLSFKTKTLSPPSVTTMYVNSVTRHSASVGGFMTNFYSPELQVMTGCGFCWNTAGNPTTSDSKTYEGNWFLTWGDDIAGLTANTTYYIRAYIICNGETIYGNQQIFKTKDVFNPIIFNPTLSYGTVADIEGNEYKTIQIGTQTWMAENLKTTKLSNGNDINYTPEASDWYALSSPGYCWYDNDPDFTRGFGALYNWYAVNTGRLCPIGWHVPSVTEWRVLIDFLGGMEAANPKIREIGITHWQSAKSDATNVSGFTALPGGCRSSDGYYYGLGYMIEVWTSTINSLDAALMFQWTFDDDGELSGSGYSEGGGFYGDGISVRCARD